MKYVSKPVRKKDAFALLTGRPVYAEDIAGGDFLFVKVLKSPYANAIIEDIDITKAMEVRGIVKILTYKDVPQVRFTLAGQTYPEWSPYDRLILDRHVRFVGDAAAIVAGENERCVIQAMRRIKIKYKVLEPVLDFLEAKDNPVLVHPEDDWNPLVDVGGDNKRNLCAHGKDSSGDVNEVLSKCDYVVDETYHTQANQQTMMETFRTFTYFDAQNRLNVLSSTQVPFHVRRILSNALQIPKSRIKVIKPRIGGGYGAKQTAVCEVYPAIVTLITGRPAKIIYSRREAQITSSPRHEMQIRVRIGADKSGIIKAIDVYTISNTGAYGEHGPTTVGLSGHKSIPIYGKTEAFRFEYDVVYTNKMSSGAYRGYGATQGFFAVESAVDELAHKMGMDPVKLREMNIVKEGQIMPAYYGEPNTSCHLDKCIARAKEIIGYDENALRKDLGGGIVRGIGAAVAMQGSGISNVDMGSVTLKINDDGFYSMLIGATDMGTGCDTILAQIAAEVLMCPVENIAVFGVDTDASPYDSGSYASATTYVTGNAAVKTANSLIEKIKTAGAKTLECHKEDCVFDGKSVTDKNTGKSVSLKDLANSNMASGFAIEATESFMSPVSPPPFMAGMAEIEIDTNTGKITPVNYAAVADCGTVINTNLAKVQTEGGIAQGMGMALYENVHYGPDGQYYSKSFMQYKIPARTDVGNIHVEFDSSYEPSGPFGAKSIGEIVINTPSPAIANAVENAIGVRIRDLPITPEKVLKALWEKEKGIEVSSHES
ncbi:MAG: molybdopterin-dependent oxidoreductase [Firmicutes bacterium]|nr:molybdopterin-dependent oxidoreductase [Bacillota bacterium]